MYFFMHFVNWVIVSEADRNLTIIMAFWRLNIEKYLAVCPSPNIYFKWFFLAIRILYKSTLYYFAPCFLYYFVWGCFKVNVQVRLFVKGHGFSRSRKLIYQENSVFFFFQQFVKIKSLNFFMKLKSTNPCLKRPPQHSWHICNLLTELSMMCTLCGDIMLSSWYSSTACTAPNFLIQLVGVCWFVSHVCVSYFDTQTLPTLLMKGALPKRVILMIL